jgi:GntR family transcriptional regulator
VQAVNETSKFQVRPLYLQVRDALVEHIKDGRWKPGGSLPSEIDLYRDLGVSLGTLRKALALLETEKLIVRQPGRGTFVRNLRAPRAKLAIMGKHGGEATHSRGESGRRRAILDTDSQSEPAPFQVRPLYLQVRDALLERVKDGRWKPGGNIPSEIDLYRELGVSLGTLRKALSVMEAEKLIVRQPGRGTFISDYKGTRTLGRFSPMRGADGEPVQGEVKKRKAKLDSPSAAERAALRLKPGDQIVRIHQVRFHEQRPFAYELRCLPDRRFPGYVGRPEAPNEIEEIAQAWGVVLARAEAKVRVMTASAAATSALALAERAQVLVMERLVYDTDGEPVEAMTATFDLQDEYCWLEMR